MSVRSHLGRDEKVLRLPEMAVAGDGPVLSGVLSVEEAQLAAARKSLRRGEQRYGNVGEYDPVLRSHCRVDREG
jgi:hypothetical protein